MSDKIAVGLYGVGKMYKVYKSRSDHLLGSMGISRLPFRRIAHNEFWALRGIELQLKEGQRIGVVGRNGAGKSTLLKLIVGNLQPTEGKLTVNGSVQALIEAGAGFHPEFTGYENARASLAYQGLSQRQIKEALEDIVDFTELGPFLEQPFKTYSSGMQVRLAFATATAIRPRILIVDEILGAGDAYFFNKSKERMTRLVEESGASVLIVSHSLDQITRFCREAIWLERGRIVKRGKAIEIVDEYQAFIETLDDRRIKARNKKMRLPHYTRDQYDLYTDQLLVRLILEGEKGSICQVSGVKLLKDEQEYDALDVGDVQDSSPYHTGFVILDGSNWSRSEKTASGFCRSLGIKEGGSPARGSVVFQSYGLFEGDYAIHIRYRCQGEARLAANVWKNGVPLAQDVELPVQCEWSDWKLPLANLSAGIVESNHREINADMEPDKHGPKDIRSLVRWPGEGSLTIEKVSLLGDRGNEQGVFSAGCSLALCLTVKAHRSGHFNFVPTASLFRLDGVFVANFIGPVYPLDFLDGGT